MTPRQRRLARATERSTATDSERVAALRAVLESRLPLDPLPELTAPALAAWLRARRWTHVGFQGAADVVTGTPLAALSRREAPTRGARQLWAHPAGEGEVALPTRGPVPDEALRLVCLLTGMTRWAIWLETITTL